MVENEDINVVYHALSLKGDKLCLDRPKAADGKIFPFFWFYERSAFDCIEDTLRIGKKSVRSSCQKDDVSLLRSTVFFYILEIELNFQCALDPLELDLLHVHRTFFFFKKQLSG